MAAGVDDLMRMYGLTEVDLKQKILITDIQELSWREVGPYLRTVKIQDIGDIDKDYHSQQEKRQALLALWKEKSGSDATYYSLVVAMLRAKKRKEAEEICKLRQNCK